MKCFIALVVAALAIGANAQTGPCASIRSRAAWNARGANTAVLPTQPPNAFVVHHTAGARCTTAALCDQQMRNIQGWHMDGNGWADIGYNFCVGDTGVIYEGRGWNRQGAHSPGFNSRSIGFCFMGTHTSVLPTAAAMNNAQAFIICARDWGRLTTTYRLLGHRQDTATACPGDALFNQIRTWPRWS